MAEKPEDRRIRRSRKLLKQGLLQLMQGKKFSEISVRDITDCVDLNRGTFYLHYTDTAELLRNLEDDLEAELQALVAAHLQESAQTNTLRPIFEPILDYLIANQKTCATLIANQDASTFFDRLQKLCYKNGHELIRMRYTSIQDDKMAYLLGYATYGLIGLVRTWFAQDMNLPKDDLILMADQFLNGAAKEMRGT